MTSSVRDRDQSIVEWLHADGVLLLGAWVLLLIASATHEQTAALLMDLSAGTGIVGSITGILWCMRSLPGSIAHPRIFAFGAVLLLNLILTGLSATLGT